MYILCSKHFQNWQSAIVILLVPFLVIFFFIFHMIYGTMHCFKCLGKYTFQIREGTLEDEQGTQTLGDPCLQLCSQPNSLDQNGGLLKNKLHNGAYVVEHKQLCLQHCSKPCLNGFLIFIVLDQSSALQDEQSTDVVQHGQLCLQHCSQPGWNRFCVRPRGRIHRPLVHRRGQLC
jgi:hypothetical protein